MRRVGIRLGPTGGRNDSVAVRFAVQVGDAAPDMAEQVCAVLKAVAPFMNCTVPVGLAPVPVPTTVAVKVTLPPPAGRLIGDAITVVVVVCPTAKLTGDVVEVA